MNHLFSNYSEKLYIMKVIDDNVSKTVETASIDIKVQSLLNSTEHEISSAHKAKMLNYSSFLALKFSDVAFIMLINVKMPTHIGQMFVF